MHYALQSRYWHGNQPSYLVIGLPRMTNDIRAAIAAALDNPLSNAGFELVDDIESALNDAADNGYLNSADDVYALADSIVPIYNADIMTMYAGIPAARGAYADEIGEIPGDVAGDAMAIMRLDLAVIIGSATYAGADAMGVSL